MSAQVSLYQEWTRQGVSWGISIRLRERPIWARRGFGSAQEAERAANAYLSETGIVRKGKMARLSIDPDQTGTGEAVNP